MILLKGNATKNRAAFEGQKKSDFEHPRKEKETKFQQKKPAEKYEKKRK